MHGFQSKLKLKKNKKEKLKKIKIKHLKCKEHFLSATIYCEMQHAE